jgi:hypothetical protein
VPVGVVGACAAPRPVVAEGDRVLDPMLRLARHPPALKRLYGPHAIEILIEGILY